MHIGLFSNIYIWVFFKYFRPRNNSNTQCMQWTDEHDQVFVREILCFEPWKFRHNSLERGQIWTNVAESLCLLEIPKFRVTQRSVRDRFSLLTKKYKKKIAAEEKASGISPNETELDIAMGDILERFSEADAEHEKANNEKKKKVEEDSGKAEEMRKRSLETFGETMQRNENTTPKKKKRSTGSEVLEYLKEKGIRDEKLRETELELKKNESENREKQQNRTFEQQQSSFQHLLESQNRQMEQIRTMNEMMMRQQQQQFVQQERQNAILMALLEKTIKK